MAANNVDSFALLQNALLSTYTLLFVWVGLTRLSSVAPDPSVHEVAVGACFATVISYRRVDALFSAVLLQDGFIEAGLRWAISS